MSSERDGRAASRARRAAPWLAALGLLVVAMLVVAHVHASSGQGAAAQPAPSSVAAGDGFPIRARLAPDFRLTDQFGRGVSLSSLKGHEVVLSFIDSRCQTVCPLTAAILRNALRQLGPAGAHRVDLVAVNANPVATRVADVYRFSEETGMLHRWSYLTGPPALLKEVYRDYQVYVCVLHDGAVVHTAAIYLIDPRGYERLYFQTLASTAGVTVGSEAQAIATGMRQWLPPAGT